MPGKRIVICCDGTWQNSDGGARTVPTNVTRLARAIEPVTPDGTPQIVYYQSGVGTSTGVIANLASGAFGEGLSENVREAYGFLAHNYFPGDKVILIGFSRGAFTARSVCGLINKIGILTRLGMDQFYEVYADYRGGTLDEARVKDLASQKGRTLIHNNSEGVTAIACFDTVGSLGIPTVGILNFRNFNKQYEFHDTKLNLGKIGYAFHALALDEHRTPFTPTMWEFPPAPQPEPLQTKLRQCWFAGVHTNIGGGYADQELADITFAWMVEMLQNVAGVIYFCKNYIGTIVKNDDDPVKGSANPANAEWAEGKLEDSATGWYLLTSGKARTPGLYTPAIKGSNFRESIHSSVRVRMEHMNKDSKNPYTPEALKKWQAVRNEQTGAWQWVKRDGDNVIELPEEPLGKMEKVIAGERVIKKYFGNEAWDLSQAEIAASNVQHLIAHPPPIANGGASQ